MAVVTIAGPIAPELIDAVAGPLTAGGHDIVAAVGQGSEAIEPGRLARTEILVPVGIRCDADLLAAAPRLRAIVTPFLGIDLIDLTAASRAGVLVANGGAREHSVSMAEATILLMLAACYELPKSVGDMDPWRAGARSIRRRMVSGLTVGVLGYGSIARIVAERLASWDVDLIVHNRTPHALPPGARFVGFDELVRNADILLVLVGLAPETRHILDRDALSRMKTDAVIVNSARGALIDEAALVDWLRESPSRRAALDVFEVEPLPPDSPLRDLPNALLTPHCAGHTQDSIAGMIRVTIANVEAAAAGRPPATTCNREILDRWPARTEAGPPA